MQKHAFVDPNRFSQGFEGGLTDRHAMNLVNLRYHPRGRFFWDERGGNLEGDGPAAGREHGSRWGRTWRSCRRSSRGTRGIPSCSARRSAIAEVTNERIARALAQFLRSMVSYQSKYDEGRAERERRRETISRTSRRRRTGARRCSCGTVRICHLPDQDAHFVMTEPVNTGLDDGHANTDGGVGDITLNPRDVGHFKSPSLRNVEVTGPLHARRAASRRSRR